jgi:hypothetical protein
MPRDINGVSGYIRKRNTRNPWLETVTRMIAVRIVEHNTMLFSLIRQYYSRRRGVGMKNKYARRYHYRKQP